MVSDEQRAFNNLGVARIHPGLALPTNVSLYAFGPNINLVIDPRNGRVGEVVSEDPYLSGQYAAAYTQGLQEGEDLRYLKVIAFLKHFTGYEEETNRWGGRERRDRVARARTVPAAAVRRSAHTPFPPSSAPPRCLQDGLQLPSQHL